MKMVVNNTRVVLTNGPVQPTYVTFTSCPVSTPMVTETITECNDWYDLTNSNLPTPCFLSPQNAHHH